MKGLIEKISPFLLHLLIVASVFDIYFKSPIVQVPEPEPPQFQAPARRVVVFVADGLRARSFFQPDASPFLQQVGYRKGLVGISHTQVPTESRPGHVALLAGLYEDPSAITRGWTENPVDFDSVLNRSTHAWAWGSPDILPMFAKGSAKDRVDTFTYSGMMEDFSSRDASYLDTWVFDRVENFFSSALEDHALQLKLREDGNLFFLHLLGCDTNGHSNKPESQEYINNIAVVDHGIDRVVQAMESYFREDGRTTYIFTADHGMTDWGSHGTGMGDETMTPFIAWGAGIKKHHDHHAASFADFLGAGFEDFAAKPEKADVKQADITPMIATLLGKSIPVNSVGQLPHQLLEMHPRDRALALKSQYEQLLAQYRELRSLHESVYLSSLYHKECPHFTRTDMDSCHLMIRKSIERSEYAEAMEASLSCIRKTYAGMTYYQRYQKNLLKLLISATLFFSLVTHGLAVLQMVCGKQAAHESAYAEDGFLKDPASLPSALSKLGLIELVFLVVLLVSWGCQRLPFHFLLYYLSPVYTLSKLRHQLKETREMRVSHKTIVTLILVFLFLSETIVFSFFERRFLTLGVILLAASFLSRKWSVTKCMPVLLLGIFSWLPPIDGRREQTALVLLAAILYAAVAAYSFVRDKSKLFLWLIISNLGSGLCVYYSSITNGLSSIVQISTWMIFSTTVPSVLVFTSDVKRRVLCLSLGLGSCYTLLSLSYESMFLLFLSLVLLFWIQDEMSFTLQPNLDRTIGWSIYEDITGIARFFFLVFYAFFGTGNIASLNSFDPSSIRCFLSVFSPFLMGGLLFIKILIPILTTGILFSYIVKLRSMNMKLVTSLLQVFTDFLSLQFFHLVRDSGSWLDIGTSLSHFIIVEGTSGFLLLLLSLSNVLISAGVKQKMSFD